MLQSKRMPEKGASNDNQERILTKSEFYSKCKCAELTFEPNYKLIPTTVFNVDDYGMQEFNSMLKFLYTSTDFTQITRTKSGGISYDRCNFYPPMYDVRALKSCVELTVVGEKMFRAQFRSKIELTTPGGISGAEAFKMFKQICIKHGINIDDFAIKNGEEVKKTIPSPRVSFNTIFDNYQLKHTHHIDIHSAYMAGIAERVPELREVIKEIYDKRKSDDRRYKAILTHTFGYFQSKMCGYRFSHLSKYAIESTIEKLDKLKKAVENAGGVIIAENTDGFWYYSKEPYHGEGEGEDLGQWHNDHSPEILLFKGGIGTYGYIENGTFTPRVRGLRNLDKVKPRSEWVLEDLDRLGQVLNYYFDGKYILKAEALDNGN